MIWGSPKYRNLKHREPPSMSIGLPWYSGQLRIALGSR